MMTWGGRRFADMLREKGRIALLRETLSWKIYSYVCENPIRECQPPLDIMAGRDDLTDREPC